MGDLRKYYPIRKSMLDSLISRKSEEVKAVDGIDLKVDEGKIFSLAGESGCGKTTTGRILAKLAEPTSGRIFFEGSDITHTQGEKLRLLRRKIQIIFQDPYASLNPRMKIGDAVGDPLEIHGLAADGEKRSRVLDMLEKVQLTPAERFMELYPHQLSGGQRQRVAIARTMILRPKFVVADEPVSMLDVSLRTTIIDLMLGLKRELTLTYFFITHDLAIAKYLSDQIAIMYLGKIVESASRQELFSDPLHPYTQALMSAIPIPSPERRRKIVELRGEVPSALDIPKGCRFHPRCPFMFDRCKTDEPELKKVGDDHKVSCHLY